MIHTFKANYSQPFSTQMDQSLIVIYFINQVIVRKLITSSLLKESLYITTIFYVHKMSKLDIWCYYLMKISNQKACPKLFKPPPNSAILVASHMLNKNMKTS